MVYPQHGSTDVFQLQEVEKPVPKDGELVVQIHAAFAHPADSSGMRGGPARLWNGLRKPKDPILGIDIAGRVEAVGTNITPFQPGDEAFGVSRGGFAEYACAADEPH